MIQCPKCGTLNQSESRFCNECGAPLVRTGVRCPECDAVNPTGNVLCDKCGARLISPASELREQFDQDEEPEKAKKTPIKGLSLPTIPLDETSDTPVEEPDWLAELRGTMREEDEAISPVEEEISTQDPWSASDKPLEPAEDLPDWLQTEDIPLSPQSFGDEETAELPDWLQGIAPDHEGPDLEEQEEPDWLQAETLQPGEQALAFDDEEEKEEPPEPAEIPDWLSELGIEQPSFASPEEEKPEPVEPVEEEKEEEFYTPDWLGGQEQQEQEPIYYEDTLQPEEPEEDVYVPDWLGGLEEEEAPSYEAAPTPAEAEEEIDMPDWLGGLEEEEPPSYEAAPTPAEPEEEIDMPDWLGGLEEEEPPSHEAAPTPAEPEEEIDMPDWLGGLEEEESPSYEAAPTPAEPEEEVEVPDWLRGLGTVDEASQPTSADVFLEQPEREAEPITEPESTEELPPPVAAEIPDWLREIEAEEPTAPAAGTDIPDWLAKPGTGPDQIAEEPSTPVFAAEESDVQIEQGDIPDWLMKMKPGAAEAGQAPTQQLPPPSDEGLAPAEIPDWLEAMRPSETVPEKEPVETEGVLEGLRGTLPSSPLVDTTGKVEAAPSIATNAATIARAELLQELLSRPSAPTLKEEEQVRKRETKWTVQHAVIMLLLLVAILAPLIANLAGFELLVVDTPGLAGSPLAAHNVIQTEIQAEDPVLVAFDYGPAQADEVDNVATPLIIHLLNRDARLILVSSRPEGLMLAERLLSDLASQGLITQEQSETQIIRLGYLPGRSMGVQSVLSNLTNFSDYWSGAFAQGTSIPAEITSIEDVSLIVVLAGESADLQTWIEQTAIFDGPPMIAGLSARVAPLSLPYMESTNQLAGTVTGLVEAASYRTARGLDNGRMILQLQSLALAQLVVVGLIVIGGVIFMLRGNKK